jgi:hypothetical protein
MIYTLRRFLLAGEYNLLRNEKKMMAQETLLVVLECCILHMSDYSYKQI